ncbi:MAG: AMP-binding protein [Gammaproteobacteria bacterium]|jgi:acetyl-CoA synthetase|nr:AMP-binding protein [Gammaproteobacteria bacterium]
MSLFENNNQSFEQLRRDFQWRIPEHYNIGVDVCDKHRQRFAAPALYLENAEGRSYSVSFGELKTRSDRFANALRGLGVTRGDRVAIILPQREEAVIAHIAVYKLGAVALPLAVLFGPDALEYRLGDSGAKLAISDAGHMDMLNDIRPRLPALETIVACDSHAGGRGFWELLESASESFEPVKTRRDDPALLIYTSGTTGPPKGALEAHRCLPGNLPGFELSQNFYPGEQDLMWTPADWAWTGGLLDALLPALHYGVPVLGYVGGRFDPEQACRLMGKHGVRNAFIPPTAIKMLMQIDSPRQKYDLKLRSIMSAGEQVGAEVVRWVSEELAVEVNEMWGQTEFNYLVGNCTAVMPVRPGSMGKPYPGHNVEPVDPSGNPMPDGEIGELAARRDDPVFFLGYWENEQATREKFIGDYWGTGDLGYRDGDGYLWFVGRKDDVISSAGHRIGPGEIEDCLIKHEAVAQAAVIGSPDELRGEVIKAFIILADGRTPSDTLAQSIQQSVKQRLAAHEYPREIEFVDSLPMTTTGKIRRIELRELEIARKGGG